MVGVGVGERRCRELQNVQGRQGSQQHEVQFGPPPNSHKCAPAHEPQRK